jgi:hypothetical protein
MRQVGLTIEGLVWLGLTKNNAQFGLIYSFFESEDVRVGYKN